VSASFSFSSAVSIEKDLDQALRQLTSKALKPLDGNADLAFVFTTPGGHAQNPELCRRLRELTGVSALIGCTGESIFGTGLEISQSPAISLLLVQLKKTHLQSLKIDCQRRKQGFEFPGWPGDLPHRMPENARLILFCDPYSFAIEEFLELANEKHPGLPVYGLVASAGREHGQHKLLMNDEVFDTGAVALYLDSPLKSRFLLSSGCLPVAEPFVISKAHDNFIEEIAGQKASELLKDIFQSSPEDIQSLLQQGVFVGFVIDEYRKEFGAGDFLIRNILGVDARSGALSLPSEIRRGQKIQFHVRDANSALEELDVLLEKTREQAVLPEAALLFSSRKRRQLLFSKAHIDSRIFQNNFGDIPLAGASSLAEICPLGGHNFLHTFSANFSLFCR
jgi:small ligand-binding sensory domain FIST